MGPKNNVLSALITPLVTLFVTQFGHQNRPSQFLAIAPSKKEIFAAPAGSDAVAFNVVPSRKKSIQIKQVQPRNTDFKLVTRGAE